MINTYRWAMQTDNYVLKTYVLQSTSRDRTVTEFYIEPVRSSNQLSSVILYHYNFPEKFATALDIQNISNYCDEDEVLILSFTYYLK